jgi:hypothetical protein
MPLDAWRDPWIVTISQKVAQVDRIPMPSFIAPQGSWTRLPDFIDVSKDALGDRVGHQLSPGFLHLDICFGSVE